MFLFPSKLIPYSPPPCPLLMKADLKREFDQPLLPGGFWITLLSDLGKRMRPGCLFSAGFPREG